MIASVGAVELISTTSVSAVIAERPIADADERRQQRQPRGRATTGMRSSSTKNATTTPMASVLVPPSSLVLTTPPENSTCRPASRAGSATRLERVERLVLEVLHRDLEVQVGEERPCRPPRGSRCPAAARRGRPPEGPPGRGRSSARPPPRTAAARASAPAGAANTIRAVAPPLPGNFSSRRSSARWDSVPGTLNASLCSPLTAWPPTARSDEQPRPRIRAPTSGAGRPSARGGTDTRTPSPSPWADELVDWCDPMSVARCGSTGGRRPGRRDG